MRSLPRMLFLVASGTNRILAWQEISNVSRLTRWWAGCGSLPSSVFLLTAFWEHTEGMVMNRKANDGFSNLHAGFFLINPLFFYYLRPFSYARKKKDQKEPRPSAGGRFFREPPQRHECNWVACDSLTCAKTSARNGFTRRTCLRPRSG